MTQSTIAGYLKNGLSMVTIQLLEDSVLFLEEACGLMKMGAALGDQSLSIRMIKIETFILVLGMMTIKNTVNSRE